MAQGCACEKLYVCSRHSCKVLWTAVGVHEACTTLCTSHNIFAYHSRLLQGYRTAVQVKCLDCSTPCCRCQVRASSSLSHSTDFLEADLAGGCGLIRVDRGVRRMHMAAGQVICCALGIACTSKADDELHSATSLLMFAKQLV